MRIYNPSNWYWIVGGDESRVFSSAAGNYVPANDATYQAWLAVNENPTRIETESALGEVLANVRIRPADAASGVIDGFKERHARVMSEEVQTKALLWCINEIRVLKGQAALTTLPQIRAFLKGIM